MLKRVFLLLFLFLEDLIASFVTDEKKWCVVDLESRVNLWNIVVFFEDLKIDSVKLFNSKQKYDGEKLFAIKAIKEIPDSPFFLLIFFLFSLFTIFLFPSVAKLILLACLVGTVNAIYPPDHWTYSTKLSSDNVDDFVKSNVDAGKTVSQIFSFFYMPQ